MTRQLVKYQETQVEAAKSVEQIAELIRRYGGSRFEQTWGEDGRVAAVRFAIRHSEIGEIPVSITAKTAQVERLLAESSYLASLPKSQRAERITRQAERIAWRHLKDLVEQLLLSTKLGLRTLPVAFLADIEVFDEAENETVTMGELFERRAVGVPGRGIELKENRSIAEVHELPPGLISDQERTT